jgi:hypothetical protein
MGRFLGRAHEKGFRVTTTDIFIKSYRPDFEWLAYCLRFIDKFAMEFRGVTIVVDSPAEVAQLFEMLRPYHFQGQAGYLMVSWHPLPEAPDNWKPDPRFPNSGTLGYVWQQAVTLSWMDFTDADAVLVMGSDQGLTGPISPELLHLEGRPVRVRRPWGDYGARQQIWRPSVEYFIGGAVAFDYLCDPAMYYTREATRGFLSFMRNRFRQTPYEYVLDPRHPQITENGAFGAYLGQIDSHGYVFRFPDQWKSTIDHRWSWGGLTPEIRADLEARLA